jgi:hypothetical protein
MRTGTRLVQLGLAVIALACGNRLTAPGHVLTGTWVDTTAGLTPQLSASSLGADFSTTCTNAHFPPLQLDDSLSFRAQGLYTEAIGLVSVRVGDPATIAGRVLGNRVILFGQGQWSFERDTLTPGSRGFGPCTA